MNHTLELWKELDTGPPEEIPAPTQSRSSPGKAFVLISILISPYFGLELSKYSNSFDELITLFVKQFGTCLLIA